MCLAVSANAQRPSWVPPHLYTPAAPPPMEAPHSEWFDRDQATHRSLLKGAKNNFLIVPVGVTGLGFSRATRSRMTTDLTVAFGKNGASLDPHTVTRAFGDGQRQIAQDSIDTLSTDLKATQRLIVNVGHDSRGQMNVAVQWAQRLDPSKPWQPAKTANYRYPIAGTAPADVFRDKAVPEIAEFAQQKIVRQASQTAPANVFSLPKDLKSLAELAQAHPFNEALTYQLLAAYAPSKPVRARERLYERSLLALQGLDQADWRVRYLLARAYLQLNERPTALALLSSPGQPPERALIALANGHLPALEVEVPLVKEDVFRLQLELDLHSLRQIYEVRIKDPVPAFLAQKRFRDSVWWPLIETRLQDKDAWGISSNINMKQLLDASLPVDGLELSSKLRGLTALGKPIDEEVLGGSIFEHVNRVRESDVRVRACIQDRASCVIVSYLDMMEALAISNFAKLIERAASLQKSYDRAEALSRSLVGILSGQPEFECARSKVALLGLQQAEPQRKASFLRSLREHASKAAYWEHEQSETTYQSMISMGLPSQGSSPFLELYQNDLPVRDFWYIPDDEPEDILLKMLQARLPYSTTGIEPFRSLLIRSRNDASAVQAIMKLLTNRFVGHPGRQELLQLERMYVKQSPTAIESKDAGLEAAFAAGKRDRPDDWGVYWSYGATLIAERGAYQEASKAFLSFPGFMDASGLNRVNLSNWAHNAGSRLFWLGAIEEARPLYEISANLKTGSAASMASATRLDVLAGHFDKAVTGSLSRATRYNDAYAYRDYLSWLFVMNQSERAWPAFDLLAAKLETPQAWLAADVGMRKEGRSWAQARKWLLDRGRSEIRLGGEKPALASAIMFNMVDREVPNDFLQTLMQIQGKKVSVFAPPEVLTPAAAEDDLQQVPPSQLASRNDPSLRAGKIDSHLVMFAQAWESLQRNQFDIAAKQFLRMASFYPIEGKVYNPPSYNYALSYYARAAAKSGTTQVLSTYLEKHEPAYFERFDHFLAKAVLKAESKDHTAAIADLKLAFYARPFTESRPVYTEYQWAETCEWLFEQSRDVRYRELVLPWLRAHQKIQPMYAWAYAMEAKLTTNESDRLRALGAALYLDPLSRRAATFSSAEKAKATQAFMLNNPFTQKKSGSTRTAAFGNGNG
jgi:hypothetical protein